MKISQKPTNHILVRADTSSESDQCDFALIACSDRWEKSIVNRLVAAESFESPGGFISFRYRDNTPDFYVSPNAEADLLPEGTDWAFVTLEESEEESFARPNSDLEAASLILYCGETGYYQTCGKHNGEEFYTADLPLADILNRLHAHRHPPKEIRKPEEEDEPKMIGIDNARIAKMAFFKLRRDEKKDAALRLANCILSYDSIKLNLGDIDWEIEAALEYCGGHTSVGRSYIASFNFTGKTQIPEERYQSLVREFYD